MRQAFFIVVLLCTGVPLARAGQLPDHPLTLREALELARARNPLLASTRARVRAVQVRVFEQGADQPRAAESYSLL